MQHHKEKITFFISDMHSPDKFDGSFRYEWIFS